MYRNADSFCDEPDSNIYNNLTLKTKIYLLAEVSMSSILVVHVASTFISCSY